MRGLPCISLRTPHRPPSAGPPAWPPPPRIVCLALVAFSLLGCVNAPGKVAEEPDVADLMNVYRRQHGHTLEQERQRQQQGIVRLDVTADRMVSVHLERASLAVVVHRLLDEHKIPYLLAREALLRGRVTARFESLPFARALNILLGTQGLKATERDGILIIEEDEPATPAAPDAKAEGDAAGAGARPAVVSASHPLRHTPADAAANYLRSLYSGVPSELGVGVAEEPSSNSIALFGAPGAVRKAMALLRQADQEPAHVFIEALVVELNSDSLMQLGMQLQDFSARAIKDLSVLNASQIAFTYLQNAAAVTTFRVILDALLQTSKARLISRPYLATVSNREARIHIGDERHVITQEIVNGVAVTATEPVEGGISLTMLPKVFEDGRIQLTVAVEDSQFLLPTANVAVIKDKNTASTVIQVVSGQSMVIGGLVLDRRSGGRDGFPWLRKLPVLNLLFGSHTESASRQEVLVLVTPYVWYPGLTVPLPGEDPFRIPALRDPAGFSDSWWAP